MSSGTSHFTLLWLQNYSPSWLQGLHSPLWWIYPIYTPLPSWTLFQLVPVAREKNQYSFMGQFKVHSQFLAQQPFLQLPEPWPRSTFAPGFSGSVSLLSGHRHPAPERPVTLPPPLSPEGGPASSHRPFHVRMKRILDNHQTNNHRHVLSTYQVLYTHALLTPHHNPIYNRWLLSTFYRGGDSNIHETQTIEE